MENLLAKIGVAVEYHQLGYGCGPGFDANVMIHLMDELRDAYYEYLGKKSAVSSALQGETK